ncbi:SpoIIE family protein phosphatase [Streptomyces sp. NPDC127098]|uniref:ATP-binding SpoIIE family protein phosphatase n=1 Tax=Streptomyces sp. NPDC127098 TaxID=3347137 RepID=UPI00365BA8EA
MLDEVDQVLAKADDFLDREHQAVRDAAEEIGWPSLPGSAEDSSGALFATTGNNIGDLPQDVAGPKQLSRYRETTRTKFIGSATRRIARGVDVEEIVLGLCRASVPAFADAILVYLLDPMPVGDDMPVFPLMLKLRRTDHMPEHPAFDNTKAPDTADPGGLLLPLLAGATPSLEVRGNGPLAEVMRGVRPVFAESEVHRAALRELTPTGTIPEGRRAIIAPLRGRRRAIGVAIFLRLPDREPFEQDDFQVAAQLATHSALGVDKAMLYGREVSIADELQRTMLPDDLPACVGVRLASRYMPAAQSSRVGGDWYDAIPLPGGRVALVVGDVMGHSTTSAAIMGQLRTTLRTLAGLDLPPQEVLHQLDEEVQRLGTDRMATCLYSVYDPVARRITAANAGHPPPVLLHVDGSTELVELPPNVPIGVGGVDFDMVEFEAPVDATLLLYTDGLVESRVRDAWTGVEHLRMKVAGLSDLVPTGTTMPLDSLCDGVLDIVGPGDRDDDIVLLAARLEGIAPENVAFRRLNPTAESLRQARRLVRDTLENWALSDLCDTAELLISEVVTNAVRYAERPVTVRLLRTDTLRCEVADDVPQMPRLRKFKPVDDVGRGLHVVEQLAERWGATRLSTGKVVWFELALPTP